MPGVVTETHVSTHVRDNLISWYIHYLSSFIPVFSSLSFSVELTFNRLILDSLPLTLPLSFPPSCLFDFNALRQLSHDWDQIVSIRSPANLFLFSIISFQCSVFPYLPPVQEALLV